MAKTSYLKSPFDQEFYNKMIRKELRQADDMMTAVCQLLKDYSPEEVATMNGISKTLIRKLKTGDPGYLWDCILWMRRKRKTEDKQCLET